MKFKICLILLLLLSLSFSSVIYAVEEYEVEHEFMPSGFVFEYNDHNTTTYEGDSGLSKAYTNNTLDNTTLILPVDRVRGVAYATKNSFKFSEPLIITRSIQRNDGMYILLTMKYKNGSVIPILAIENNSLTNEQKSYFDDYESQRADYLQQQQQYALEDIEDSYSRSSRQKDRHSKYGYFYSPRSGYGVIYNP